MFGDRLKEIRAHKKISQAALAEAVGKSQSTVASWENGTRKPLIDEIVSLASIFKCSADYLLEITQDFPDPLAASLSADEKSLVEGFRSLSQAGKDYISHQMSIALHIYEQRGRDERVEGQA